MDVKDLKPGDILLYSPIKGQAIGWAISILTRSPVCHAGLYVGGEISGEISVAEEGFDGLKLYSLADSFGQRKIYVKRLSSPKDMAPVINIAKGYLKNGEQYGFYDIVLLAVSLVNADFALINPAAFAAMVLAEALIPFLKWHYDKIKQHPMICSQFVYTCYDEAGKDYDPGCSLICGQDGNTLLSHAEKYDPKAVSLPQGATTELLYEKILKACEELIKFFPASDKTDVAESSPEITELPNFLLHAIKSLDDALKPYDSDPSLKSYRIKPSDLYRKCKNITDVGIIRDRLHGKENEYLLPGESLESLSGEFQLVYQKDGNLVLYRIRDKADLWASRTNGKTAWKTCMQPDGNFVVYEAENKAVWSSNKYGHQYAESVIIMQNDGNLVIYDRHDKPFWWAFPPKP